jgi:hypothetical protein
MTGRRGRRSKQLLNDLKRTRGHWNMKEKALDRTVWRMRFSRCYGPVVRQSTDLMDYTFYVFLTILFLIR